MPLERALTQDAAATTKASTDEEKQRETEEAKGKQITLIAYKRTRKNNPQCYCPPMRCFLSLSHFENIFICQAAPLYPPHLRRQHLNQFNCKFFNFERLFQLVYFCSKHLPHSSILLSISLSDNCVRSTSDSIMKALSANCHQTPSPQYLNCCNELRHKN